MDELVNTVAEKTGLAADMVRPVVQTVIDELKKRLPEPIANQVDGLLGNPMAGDVIDQAAGMLGGLFGNKSA
ncbi:MAG: DUF2267 domain-containing protein [Roseiflexaceae bacterium]|nr:DUF2267 domain-containing protein [Roseiflexaceae bacterium]